MRTNKALILFVFSTFYPQFISVRFAINQSPPRKNNPSLSPYIFACICYCNNNHPLLSHTLCTALPYPAPIVQSPSPHITSISMPNEQSWLCKFSVRQGWVISFWCFVIVWSCVWCIVPFVRVDLKPFRT